MVVFSSTYMEEKMSL